MFRALKSIILPDNVFVIFAFNFFYVNKSPKMCQKIYMPNSKWFEIKTSSVTLNFVGTCC